MHMNYSAVAIYISNAITHCDYTRIPFHSLPFRLSSIWKLRKFFLVCTKLFIWNDIWYALVDTLPCIDLDPFSICNCIFSSYLFVDIRIGVANLFMCLFRVNLYSMRPFGCWLFFNDFKFNSFQEKFTK